ncbi:MAG: inorganic diphosphatase [Bacteroidota bacterium]
MEAITVIIETPKGNGQKFDFDPALGCFKLKKVMPVGMVFPFDFGYIPGTVGGDGDPLDVVVISELDTFTGCAMDCRVIGALKASQKERDGKQMRNDRFLLVPQVSVQYAGVNSLNDLPKGMLNQVVSFFENYNEQAGKAFKVLARLDAAKASKRIEAGAAKDSQDTLIQLVVPVYDPKGKRFPKRHYSQLHSQLTDKFGGLTVYRRSPAKGFWKQDEGQTVKEKILVYEVMAANVELDFWQKLKASLLKKFEQDELLITSSKISRV